MNNKGFMMAEVVVVSAIIIITLTTLYISYNKILSAYNQRVDYYDVTTLYQLSDIRDKNSLVGQSSKDIILNESYRKVYYVKNNDIENLTVSNQTFKDYLSYIKDAVTFETEYILVMERCINNNNCKYAYLEVYE